MISAHPPADQAARERFARETGRNFAVCAGAGTGKTTAISSRIARLVLEDALAGTNHAAQLVVVTYTKAAAAELRARALETSLIAIREPAAAGHGDLARPAGSQAQRAVGGLQRAFFGTIHSFCLSLLAAHGAALGLPARIQLADDQTVARLGERFAQSAEADAIPISRTLLRLIPYEDLLGVALEAEGERLPPSLGSSPPKPDFSRLLRTVVRGNSVKNAERTKAASRRWLTEWDSEAEFIGLPTLSGKTGEIVVAWEEAMAPLHLWIEHARAEAEGRLAAGFAAYRVQEGMLGFQDMIRLTRDLLRDRPTLESIRAEAPRVLLDEAQDTSGTMFEILAEISRLPGTPTGEWPDDPTAPPPRPGHFSFVGDDQQSIYRNRASPADFARYRNALESAGQDEAQIELSVTMRCDEALVRLTNAVFADAGIAIVSGGAPYRTLISRPHAGPGAVWRLPLTPLTSGNSEATRDAEAHQVASWLQRTGCEALGVARWSDIAIIAPRKDWLAPIARHLEDAGVPIRLRAVQQIARLQPDWSWLTAILHVLLEPWDRFELIGVLRDIFGLSDVTLLKVHRLGALQFLTPPAAEIAAICPRAEAALQTLFELRTFASGPKATPIGLVDAILSATNLAGRLAALDLPTEPLEALREAAARAGCEGRDIRTWVRERITALEAIEPELPPAGDGVEIIGAQKAKGLQWPVVIAVGLGQPIGEARSPDGDFTARDDEFRRFLYVTLTRARRLLVLPDSTGGFYRRPKSNEAAYSTLLPHLAQVIAELPEAPPGGAGAADAEARPAGIAPVVEDAVPWHAAAAVRPLARGIRASDAPSRPRRPADGPVPLLEAPGGRDYGTWWHESVATFPWHWDESWRANWARKALATLEDPETRARGEIECDRLLACAGLAELAAAHPRILIEVPFTHAIATTPPRWLEGVIDAVLIDAAGIATVLEWKTDRRQEDESDADMIARLRREHRAQLSLYVGALRVGLGLHVRDGLLYSTALGRVIEITAAS